MIKENFIKLYENSFRENWDLPCYTNYGEPESYTYGEVAEEIAKLHLLFKHCSLRRGDKIAVIGKNNARWCIAYMATITYGAIIVPILQDFNPNDVHHIVNHSESVFLFTSDTIWENLEEERLTGIRAVFSLTDFRCLHQRDGETVQKFLKHIDQYMTDTYPKGFRKEDVLYTTLSNDKVMLLNYTSGTTGFSKGVMLTGNNLAGNVTFGIRTELLKKGDKVLSFLPLAHAYGCAFDFLTATAVGTHVTLLGKVPSPKIIMKAFEEVKPNLIITVPLVIEKIYKNVIQPIISKKGMKWALSIPLLDNQIYGQIRKKLIDALGGVTVYSDYDFDSKNETGYHFNQGENYLNGEQALVFSRERYAFKEGDRQRGKNQMAVIKGVINKALSPELLKNYSSVLSSIQGCFETNISYEEIARLLQQQLNNGGDWNIVSYSVNGTGDTQKPYSMSQKAYVMIPDESTVQKAEAMMKKVRDGETVSQEEADSATSVAEATDNDAQAAAEGSTAEAQGETADATQNGTADAQAADGTVAQQ